MFQAGQLLPEEDNLMSPLPMRQLNASNASLAAKCGNKRVAPAAIDPSKTPRHILQSVLLSINMKYLEECTSALPHEYSWLSCAGYSQADWLKAKYPDIALVSSHLPLAELLYLNPLNIRHCHCWMLLICTAIYGKCAAC